MGAEQELANNIHRILWEDWDPVGMCGMEGSRDEYSEYAAEIFSMALANAPAVKIAAKLNHIVVENSGEDNMEHCKKIADKILAAKKTLRV
jgi:hypothetical protein